MEYATDCGVGTYVSFSSANCSKCPGGTFANSSFSLRCTTCAPGYHSFYPGASSCMACEAGTYPPTSDVLLCPECQPGRFSLNGSATCLACPLARYVPYPGSAQS